MIQYVKFILSIQTNILGGFTMNKKTFETYLNEEFKNLPLEKQVEFLYKIKDEWVINIISKKTKSFSFCKSCKRYYLTKDEKIEIKREIRGECTYRDAGYGDDDEYGDVEYLVHYYHCPLCNKVIGEKKEYIRTLSSTPRWK